MSVGKQVLCGMASPVTLVAEASGELFPDSSCGEALVAQRVVLDFSPDADLDPEFVKRKCVAFWQLVEGNPRLQSLATFPQHYEIDKRSPAPSSDYASTKESLVGEDGMKTALSMLELLEHKGMMDCALEGKFPRSYSKGTLGEPRYSANDSTPITEEKGPDGDGRRTNKKTQHALKKLCSKLNEWDVTHPRYKKPPGHSQTLLTCKRRTRKDVS